MFKLSKVGIFLILFLIALVIYSSSINGEFLFDDKILITDNMYIKSLKYIPVLFSTDIFMPSIANVEKVYNYYRPLQTSLFALNYRIWGLNPFGYHFSNIVLHVLASFALFCLLFKLFSDFSLALLTSVLFCVHPIQTEAVSCISGSAEVLAGLFTLLTILFYLKYLDSRKGMELAIAILSFVAALISKEAGYLMLVPFTILFFGLKKWRQKDSVTLHFFIFSGLVAIYWILRLSILAPIKMVPYNSPSFIFDIINFSRAIAEYVKVLVFPCDLHILRSIPAAFSFKPFYLVFPAGITVAGIAVMVISLKRKKFVLLFGLAWFLLSFSHLFRTMYKFSADIAVEEHWAYLPSIGFFIIVSYFILRLKKFKNIAIVSIVIIYAGLSFINGLHWRKQVDFYRYNLKFIRPNIGLIPRFNYANMLNNKGLFNDALIEVEAMLKIDPNRFSLYILRGDIFMGMGKFAEAEKSYRQALGLDRFCWQANLKLKNMQLKTGRPYKEEIEPWLSPEQAKVVSYIMNGDFYDAITAVDQLLEIQPSALAYTLKGIIFSKTGHYRAALNAYNEALKLNPDDKIATYNLAVLYYNMNKPDKVEEVRKRFERLK